MRLIGNTHSFPNLPEPWASVAIAGMAIAGVIGAALIIATVASVVGSPSPIPVKVGWSVFTVAMPPVGIPLWWFVGRGFYR